MATRTVTAVRGVPDAARRMHVLLLVLLAAACAGGPGPARQSAPPSRAPLPAATGIFAVGSILLDVHDTRPVEAMPEGLSRTIQAQIWYPAQRGANGERMPYFPRRSVLDELLASGYMAQPRERLVEWAAMDVAALRGALPGVRPGGFPLLVFAPARAVPAEQYASLLQDLASRGFVVVAVSPRAPGSPAFRRTSLGGSGSDDLDERAIDVSIVLRRFVSATGTVGAISQRADLTRAGAFGHAAGGIVALRACALEPALQRCASLDGAPSDADRARPLPRPHLVIASRPDTVPTGAIPPLPDDLPERWRPIFAHSTSAPGALFELEGASTMTFTDAAFLTPAVTGALGQRGDPEVLQRVASDVLDAFFAERDGDPLAAVAAVAALTPELSRAR